MAESTNQAFALIESEPRKELDASANRGDLEPLDRSRSLSIGIAAVSAIRKRYFRPRTSFRHGSFLEKLVAAASWGTPVILAHAAARWRA